MRVYTLSAELLEVAWRDADDVRKHPVSQRIAAQLYSAVGSIGANLAEGYSRFSGPDRARLFEFALGSARESSVWYQAAMPVLGAEKVETRLQTLDEIRRMLLAIIPRERRRRSIQRTSVRTPSE
jgi:four helix bundle protein